MRAKYILYFFVAVIFAGCNLEVKLSEPPPLDLEPPPPPPPPPPPSLYKFWKQCVTLCSTFKDSLTADEIIRCGKLVSTNTNYRIVSFEIRDSLNDGITQNEGEYFSAESNNFIKELKKGDCLIFDEIKLAMTNDTVSRICYLEIPIK